MLKKYAFQILAIVLAIATSASADELDTLIYKMRGGTPPASPRKVIASPSVAPQNHADLAKKLRGDSTPHPPATPAPAPVTPPPALRPPESKLPPTARPPAAVTPPVKTPSLASVGKDVALEVVPEKLEAEENETIFPAGSKASRCADSRLKIVVPKAGTQLFPAGSRAFRLKDGSLKVLPPKPPTPDSEIIHQN